MSEKRVRLQQMEDKAAGLRATLAAARAENARERERRDEAVSRAARLEASCEAHRARKKQLQGCVAASVHERKQRASLDQMRNEEEAGKISQQLRVESDQHAESTSTLREGIRKQQEERDRCVLVLKQVSERARNIQENLSGLEDRKRQLGEALMHLALRKLAMDEADARVGGEAQSRLAELLSQRKLRVAALKVEKDTLEESLGATRDDLEKAKEKVSSLEKSLRETLQFLTED